MACQKVKRNPLSGQNQTPPPLCHCHFLQSSQPELSSHTDMEMEFHYRKLLSESTEFSTICRALCEDSDSGVACSSCSPPPKHHRLSSYLIISFSVLATAFVVLCLYVFYVKYCSPRRRPTRSVGEADGVRQDFVHGDQEPVLDHPIWYIRTVGLQPSVISAITICKYKRGDGLVEGTECSVCLSEFQEDESLRLLPKCNHAFHIPCIDTWLSSHTNCPLCRAGIVSSTAGTPSPELGMGDSGPSEETQLEIPESGDQVAETEDVVRESRTGREEEGELRVEDERNSSELAKEEAGEIQPMRRSVSMDSLSASMISLALANVHPPKSSANWDSHLAKSKKPVLAVVPKRVCGNQNLMKLMEGSSMGRILQTGSSSMKRSFSCSGKLFLMRHNRRRSSVPPL